jgi:hypothetical protein
MKMVILNPNCPLGDLFTHPATVTHYKSTDYANGVH